MMDRRGFLKLGLTSLGGLLLVPYSARAEDVAALPEGAPTEGRLGGILQGESLESLEPGLYSLPEGDDWKGIVFHGERGERKIALTLDDGPSRYTPDYLDILKDFRVPCTFFLIGENIRDRDPGFYHRYLAEGHELANHTWSHPNIVNRGNSAVTREINRAQERILQKMGMAPRVFRPPYGGINARTAECIKETTELKAVIMWDVDPYDWREPGWHSITDRILRSAQGGSIILGHDNHGQARRSLPVLIDYLQLRGYEFVTMSELLFGRIPAMG